MKFDESKLKDAQGKRIKDFETFEAPTKEDLDAIKINDFVQICYETERFWCIVKEIDGYKIKAIVDNDLFFIKDFKNKDTISFIKNNIYKIYINNPKT